MTNNSRLLTRLYAARLYAAIVEEEDYCKGRGRHLDRFPSLIAQMSKGVWLVIEFVSLPFWAELASTVHVPVRYIIIITGVSSV